MYVTLVMAGEKSTVLQVLRVVIKCLKVLGGFPYSWDTTSQVLPHDNSTAQEKHGVPDGLWARSRSAESWQQICPKLKLVRWHRARVAAMGLFYLSCLTICVYETISNGFPNDKLANGVIFSIHDVITNVVLTLLLTHMLAKSNCLAVLVSHLDTLPYGPSLYTWAAAYPSHTIPLVVMLFLSTFYVWFEIPIFLRGKTTLASVIIYTVKFLTSSTVTYIILVLYNILEYLMCTLLATHMRDLRLTLEKMRDKAQAGKSIHDNLRLKVGPMLSDLWRAQTLLNAYLGPIILLHMTLMVAGTISCSYYVVAERNLVLLFFLAVNFLNLTYLCHAPALMHDQVKEWTMEAWAHMETQGRQSQGRHEGRLDKATQSRNRERLSYVSISVLIQYKPLVFSFLLFCVARAACFSKCVRPRKL